MCSLGMYPPSIKAQFFGKIATWLFKDLSESNSHIFMKRSENHSKHFLLVLHSDNGEDAQGIILEEGDCFMDELCKEQQKIIIDNVVAVLKGISRLPEVNLSLGRTEHYFIGGLYPQDSNSVLSFDHFKVGTTQGAQYLVRDISQGDRVNSRVTAMISALISMEDVIVNLCEVVIGKTKLSTMFGDGVEFPIHLDHYIERELKCLRTISVSDITDSSKNCGTFLVRNVGNHLESFQQDSLSTFLIDERLSFEEASAKFENVHEVIYEPDYRLLVWQRSSKSTDQISEFLFSFDDDAGLNSLSLSHSVNVLRSESSFGQTYYLRNLHQKLTNEDCSRWIQCIDRTMLERMVIEDPEIFERSPKEITSRLFGVSGELQMKVFEYTSQIPGRMMLLIDGVSDSPKEYYPSFAKYLQQIYHEYPLIIVWVSSRQFLCQTIMRYVPIVPSEMLGFDKEKVRVLLAKLSGAGHNFESVDNFLDKAKPQNTRYISDDEMCHDFLENPLNLQLCASLIRDPEAASFFRDIDIYYYHVQKKYSIEDNQVLRALGLAAAQQFISTEFGDLVQIPEAENSFQLKLKKESRVIIEYLAASYYVLSEKFPAEEVLFSEPTKRILNMMDRIACRSSELATAVLNGDLETVLVQSEQLDLRAIKDSFNRNLLYLVNDKNRGICEYLVDRGVSVLEKDDLLNWSPLRYADAKRAYSIVDVLLKAGGDSTDLVGIRSASSKELEKIFCDCHCCGNDAVCQYIIENVDHFQVTSRVIYNVSDIKCSFPRALVLKTLNLAKTQNFKATSCRPYTMNGYTPVHLAVMDTKGIEIVQMLVEDLGYDVNSKCLDGRTPFCDVISVDMVKYLIQMGVDPFEIDDQCNHRTLFHTACMNRNLEIVKYCLEELKADPNELNKSEIPPLHYAAGSGNLKLLKYLFASGFNQVNQQDLLNGETPLHNACANDHLDIVKFLLQNGADINKEDKFKRRPIESLFRYDSSGLRKFLVENGATCSMEDIFHFLESTSLDFIQLAISKLPDSINWNYRNEHGETYLHFCAQYVHDRDVIAFFADRCDLELYTTENGLTALHLAFCSGNKEAIDVLIQRGADILARTKTGNTMMHSASVSPSREAFEILFNYGLDVNASNDLGERPVHYYGLSLGKDSFEYLIQNGLDVNAQDKEGQTALHKLCKNNYMFSTENVEFCLKYLQINPQILDKRGRTALHYAAEKKNLDVIKMLAKYHPLNLEAADCAGETPMSITKRENNESIVKYFQKVLEIQNKTD